MHYLEKIASHSLEWRKYLVKMGAKEKDTDDFIQDLYIRIHDYNLKDKVIKSDGSVNKTYIWYILRTVWLNKYYVDRRHPMVDLEVLGDSLEYSETSNDEQESFLMLSEVVLKSSNESDNEIFKDWVFNGDSMRSMAKREDSNVTAIFLNVKDAKNKVISKHLEMYKAYCEGDYETVKNIYNDKKED